MHTESTHVEKRSKSAAHMQPSIKALDWNPEDPTFWESRGSRIANRNLLISIVSLMLAFTVWMLWSVVVVNLTNIGFAFSTSELFWLAALPALCGATLRIFYPWFVPIFGGRRWTAISTALLLIPTLGIGICVQNPTTSYWTFAVFSLLCGFGGGIFASSMANINFFFPTTRKGFALGLNAGLGNLGVSLAQFIVPVVITENLFGTLGGGAQIWGPTGDATQVWMQNAGFVWVPFIVAIAIIAWFGMDDVIPSQETLFSEIKAFRRSHSWIISILYLGTFGSFIGYSAGLPLLIKTQFPQMDALSYAWLGPLIGALFRPFGGLLADKFGGAKVTLWNFVAMSVGVLGVLGSLPHNGQEGNFYAFLAMFLILFVTAGIGNGSVFQMIPIILLGERQHAVANYGTLSEERAVQQANVESAAVFGLASAIGAFGGFFIPMSYGASIIMNGSVKTALWTFVTFYIACVGLTWWNYTRRDALSRR